MKNHWWKLAPVGLLLLAGCTFEAPFQPSASVQSVTTGVQ